MVQRHHGSWLGRGTCMRLVTLLIIVLQVWNLSWRSKNLPRRNHLFEVPTHHHKEPVWFSPEWVMQYATGDAGCDVAMGSYLWRGHGLGSNINSKSKQHGVQTTRQDETAYRLYIYFSKYKGCECCSTRWWSASYAGCSRSGM